MPDDDPIMATIDTAVDRVVDAIAGDSQTFALQVLLRDALYDFAAGILAAAKADQPLPIVTQYSTGVALMDGSFG